MNKYFTGIGPQVAKKFACVDNSNNFSEVWYKPEATRCRNNTFDLEQVDTVDILSELEKLNGKKSQGLDCILALLVTRSAHFLAAPLTHVINLSISNGDVPKRMKQARVRAIYKNKGDRKLCGNYRPISILPIFSKILERVVTNQLHSYFSTCKIITPSQYGFQRNKGAVDALIDLIH